ncbi:hypothetical protein ACFQZO_34575 [Bradyrhizobium sp. GCM10027634]|uniref:hypothetical protein n=1 Tax=unclassified Bradyrhizobium TaxID=2631580 RepID=UPI00188A1B26|nr:MULTISPECIES: hypothetical protein [unclassified Bradyrhizobium]MDN5005980.1 hypothetical protein [Bradyrhizobium sp. WYCCWR 12677]
MALGARPDDNAKMVWSRGCMAYLSGSLRKGKRLVSAGQEQDFAATNPAANTILHRNISAAFLLQSKPFGKNEARQISSIMSRYQHIKG